MLLASRVSTCHGLALLAEQVLSFAGFGAPLATAIARRLHRPASDTEDADFGGRQGLLESDPQLVKLVAHLALVS